jgi:fimbrial chaperone protein
MQRRPFVIGLGISCAARTVRADVARTLGERVEISPTTLSLSGPGSTTTCTVLNNANATTASQIRLRQWYQSYGRDVLTDTTDVVASPPFISLDPGTRQIVRVANLSAQPGASEMCYRLLLNELPSAGSLTNSGIAVLIAFSLPVFVAGTDAAPPQLSAQFAQGDDGRPVLRLINGGDIHARLADISYTVSSDVLFRLPGLAGYVLPHSTRDLPLPVLQLPPPGGVLLGQTQLQLVPTQIDLR